VSTSPAPAAAASAVPPLVAPLDLVVVEVTGDDRVRYLDDVTSQAVAQVPPGHVTSALYLDVHGAPLAAFDVVVAPDKLLLLVPSDAADTVVDVLGGRTFLLDARFTRTVDEVLALRGDADGAVAAAVGCKARPGRCLPGGDVLVVGRDGGVDLIGPAAAVAEVRAQLVDAGAADGDADDLEAWRIASGVPAWGREIVAPHLPEELGLLPTHVHLAKGCYPGQEAVARMWMLGRPRRRIAQVEVQGSVAPGWETGVGRRKATVTSVASDGRRALAFVPGDAAPGDAYTDDDGNGLRVAALIGDDPAPPGHDPAVTRRRDRR
jgi:tRNA-modifying protein YgfZ